MLSWPSLLLVGNAFGSIRINTRSTRHIIFQLFSGILPVINLISVISPCFVPLCQFCFGLDLNFSPHIPWSGFPFLPGHINGFLFLFCGHNSIQLGSQLLASPRVKPHLSTRVRLTSRFESALAILYN